MRYPSSSVAQSTRQLHSQTKRVVRGVVFDMDGTCTKACIDFKEMRRRAGILTGDILGTLDELPPERRKEAVKAIEDVENEALPRMQVMPGLQELCQLLDASRVPRGIITRNSQLSVDHFHTTFFSDAQQFLPALCRDFRPFKPSPAALLNICSVWNIQPQECLMVGDSVKDDVVSGNRANAMTVLLDVEGRYSKDQTLRSEESPNFVVRSMPELAELLQSTLQLAEVKQAR